MSKISTSFENQEYTEKLQVGPTTSNPGPILLKHAATADTFVVMDSPSIEIKRKLPTKITP